MINNRFYKLGSMRSVIRELFEYGIKRKKEIGEENVFDFSLGNPSIEPPKTVKESIQNLVQTKNATRLHGYTSAQGDLSVRQAVANNIKSRFGVQMTPDLIYMTCGAAASLTISLSAICPEGKNEVIAFAPFFPEYRVFAETASAKLVVSKPLDDMTIDLANFESLINQNTRGVILNSPNNPSGVVVSEKTIIKIAEILSRKQNEFNNPIYLISDEPYRELTYGVKVPYLMNYYDNTVVCYSYSKSLSLPGERIGYIAVSPKADDKVELYLSICGAGRALGYVCAPSLFQFVAMDNVDKTADIESYRKNRDVLCDALSSYGYEFAKPDGAFYLFVKAPDGNSELFCERAKKHEILIVAGTGFGAPTHARIAYCVSYEQIVRSLPHFKALIEEYKN